MTTSILGIVREYLDRTIELASLREWLALNQWDLTGADRNLADDVDVAIAYLDNGYSSEPDFRLNLLSVVLAITTKTVTSQIPLDITAPKGPPRVVIVSTDSSSGNRLNPLLALTA